MRIILFFFFSFFMASQTVLGKTDVNPAVNRRAAEIYRRNTEAQSSTTKQNDGKKELKKNINMKINILDAYNLRLAVKEGKFLVDKISVGKYFFTPKTADRGQYVAVLKDKTDSILYKKIFNVPTEGTICPQPDWFDNKTGDQKFFPEKSVVQNVSSYHELLIPYHSDAVRIQIINLKNGGIFLEQDVAFFSPQYKPVVNE